MIEEQQPYPRQKCEHEGETKRMGEQGREQQLGMACMITSGRPRVVPPDGASGTSRACRHAMTYDGV
jgi:hypothetical protein